VVWRELSFDHAPKYMELGCGPSKNARHFVRGAWRRRLVVWLSGSQAASVHAFSVESKRQRRRVAFAFAGRVARNAKQVARGGTAVIVYAAAAR
jgi:hypothetical protein